MPDPKSTLRAQKFDLFHAFDTFFDSAQSPIGPGAIFLCVRWDKGWLISTTTFEDLKSRGSKKAVAELSEMIKEKMMKAETIFQKKDSLG